MACRSGITFLESILGVVLLGLVTATLAGSVSFMARSENRLERKLAAGEIANRLILQFIDDRQSLPSPSLPVEYGPDLYRWELEEQPVKFVTETQGTSASQGGVGGGVSLDRVHFVIVRVWLAPDSGGSVRYDPDVPSMVLTRLVDPLAFSNPDSLETLLNQSDGIERLMQLLLQLEDGSGNTGGAGGTAP